MLNIKHKKNEIERLEQIKQSIDLVHIKKLNGDNK